MAVNIAPIGALAMARISEILMRQTRAMKAFTAMNRYANMLIHALGTWTKMIR